MFWEQLLGALFNHSCSRDVVELREVVLQVRVASNIDGALIRLLLILCGNRQSHIKTVNYLPQRTETFLVEIDVVSQIYEQLRRSGVRPSRSVGNGAFEVGDLHGIIKNVGVLPLLSNGCVATNAKLGYKSGHDTEKSGVVVVASSLKHEKLVQTVDPMRGIGARDVEQNFASSDSHSGSQF